MATQLDKIKRDLIVDTVMTRAGCSERAARAELVRMNWDAADAIRSLQELAVAKRVKAGAAEALQLNIDAAQRELNRRDAEGEDVSHLRVCQQTAAIVPLDAKAEAIANADAHTNNVGLPTYSELVEALRKLRGGPVFHCVAEDRERHWPQIAAADALLTRIPA